MRTGLQALYTFEEGNGTTVHGVSGVGTPLDLEIANPSATRWVEGGLVITASAILSTSAAANKIIDAAKLTNELTIEAWVRPDRLDHEGIDRIATLSSDTLSRNYSLLQERDDSRANGVYSTRLRTTDTNRNGKPDLQTSEATVYDKLTHGVSQSGRPR